MSFGLVTGDRKRHSAPRRANAGTEPLPDFPRVPFLAASPMSLADGETRDVLYGVDLFSGIGGITEALSEWVRPVAYCERDRFAQGVLLSRMAKGQLPRAPIWDDVTTLRGSMLPVVDIIYGGFPCQDISVAGRQFGLAGERSGLIREVWRLADELRPRFIFLENVPAIIGNGLDQVLGALAERGYDARWLCLSAAEVGACHIRNRWWLLAYSERPDVGRWEQFPSPAVQSRLQAQSEQDSQDGRTTDTVSPGQLQPQGSVSEVRGWLGDSGSADVTDTNISRLEGWNGAELRECANEWTTRSSSPFIENTNHTGQERGRSGESRRISLRLEGSIGWPTVAPVCGGTYGLPDQLDKGGYDATEESEEVSGTPKVTRPAEGVSDMRSSVHPWFLWEQDGGSRSVQPSSVLQQGVLRPGTCQRCAHKQQYFSFARTEAIERLLRGLWYDGEVMHSPRRWEALEQLTRESPDIMRELSHVPPPPCATCWQDGSWCADVAPVVTGAMKDRANRIAALGNSVVPQAAREAFKRLSGL